MANLADLRNKALELLALAIQVCECKSRAKGGRAKLTLRKKKKEFDWIAKYSINDDDYMSDSYLPYEEIAKDIVDVEDFELSVESQSFDTEKQDAILDYVKLKILEVYRSIDEPVKERLLQEKLREEEELYFAFIALAADD